MALFDPPTPGDALTAFNQIMDPGPRTFEGFSPSAVPSASGAGTRQSKLNNNRPGYSTRHLMKWFAPEQPIIEMYINPQNVNYGEKKTINKTRTKGGFLIQYWGEELQVLNISGHTGTSGVEGINVLRDIYRNEQLAFDPYALYVQAAAEATGIEGLGSEIGGAIGGGLGSAIGGAIGGMFQSAINGVNPASARPAPSLAQMACSVELYWSGEVYRGYFESFDVTESVDKLGMLSYDISFTVTQKRGFRQNFMPWHRSPINGPSNSDPNFGTPYSYGSLVSTPAGTSIYAPEEKGILDNLADSVGFGL